MKNPTPDQLSVLRKRAAQIRSSLPNAKDPEAFSAAAQRILRRERAVGASLVLLHPGGRTESFCFGHARLSPRIP